MKYVFVLLALSVLSRAAHADKVLYVTDAGDTTVLVTLTQPQVHALQHDLVDIGTWIKKAVEGKVSNCRSGMIQEWMPKLQADPAITSLPVKEDDLIELIWVRDDYEDRAETEAKQK